MSKESLKKAFFVCFGEDIYSHVNEDDLTPLKNYAQGVKEGRTDEPIDVDNICSGQVIDSYNAFMDEIYNHKDEYIETIENLQVISNQFVYAKREFYPDLLNKILSLVVTELEPWCADDDDEIHDKTISYYALDDVEDFSTTFGYEIKSSEPKVNEPIITVTPFDNSLGLTISKCLRWVGKDRPVDDDVYQYLSECKGMAIGAGAGAMSFAINKDIAYFGNYDMSNVIKRMLEDGKLKAELYDYDLELIVSED